MEIRSYKYSMIVARVARTFCPANAGRDMHFDCAMRTANGPYLAYGLRDWDSHLAVPREILIVAEHQGYGILFPYL